MNRKELGTYAQEVLGHTNVTLWPRVQGGYVVTCDCGWRSVKRVTKGQATEAAVHHLEGSARTHLRNLRTSGVSPS